MTQQALADAVGVTVNMIGRYEAGNASPYVNTFGRIASRLGMSEVSVNGFKFHVTQPRPAVSAVEQLTLDLNKEHVFSGAEIRITPTKLTLTITAVTPPEPSRSSEPEAKERAS
jgi:transcriptional regulator with XRE-family HTH domain